MDNLATKLTDEEWVAKQDVAFINNLHQVTNIVHNLSAQVYLFIDLFQQYVEAMQQSPIFSVSETVQSDEHSTVSPTQTPANREERRAKAKQNKKLLVPEKKLIVP